MIYTGYQGIGKSSIASKIPNVIDLESSNFYVNGYDKGRCEDWYKIYATIAKHLSDQGKIVFISTHKSIREYMNRQGIEFTAVFPAPELKDQWIEKLMKRYELSQSFKDFRALAGTYGDKYDKNIEDLSKEKNKIVITDINYSLEELIFNNTK